MILLGALSAAAQDNDFQISAEIKAKYFLLNNEPDLIRADYRGYEGTAGYEAGLLAHFDVFSKFSVDLYPYFWYSEENHLVRVGLKGEAKYEVLRDWLKVGYGHHSWHNADVDTPDNGGRTQDWLLAELNFWGPLFLETKLFLGNSHPIEARDFYDGSETEALYEVALAVRGQLWKFDYRLRPYFQASSKSSCYGIDAEVIFPVLKQFSVFADCHYHRSEEDRLMVGVGVIVKFR